MPHKVHKPIVIKNMVKVIRWSVGASPVKQTNDKAPVRRGWWAFFKGMDSIEITGASFDKSGALPPTPVRPEFSTDPNHKRTEEEWKIWDKYLDDLGQWRDKYQDLYWTLMKAREFWLPLDEFIYCGWTPKGVFTRSGFFNCGEWECHTVEDALKGVNKAWARAVGHSLRPNVRRPHETDLQYMMRGSRIPEHNLDMADFQIFIPHSARLKG